jgi:creatinine amidohydrolase
MAVSPFELELMNLAEVRAARFEVAVLPLGATEPHNLHLPYGTDFFEARRIGQELCSWASQRGARVALLPTIPYGTETNLREFPLAINLNPSTVGQVIADIVESVGQSGIRKLLLLNSHGGNDLKPLLRELGPKTDVRLFLCNWWQAIGDLAGQLLEHRDDHAGELETSFMLAYFPELVARDPAGRLLADEGAKRPARFAALNEGWVSISRPWHLLTTNSGAGNPYAATPEKGRQVMAGIVERIGQFLVELAASPLDERFPY